MNASTPDLTERDIVFECPECGKSLAIDEQGAGLVVNCPDCGGRMQVPVPERFAEAAPGAEAAPAVATSPEAQGLQEKVERLQLSIEEVEARKKLLEKMRIDHALRFERIREELALIQAALDRIVDALQDFDAGKPA